MSLVITVGADDFDVIATRIVANEDFNEVLSCRQSQIPIKLLSSLDPQNPRHHKSHFTPRLQPAFHRNFHKSPLLFFIILELHCTN